jgi:hypothetical protein
MEKANRTILTMFCNGVGAISSSGSAVAGSMIFSVILVPVVGSQ